MNIRVMNEKLRIKKRPRRLHSIAPGFSLENQKICVLLRVSSMESPWYPSENARWTPEAPFPRPVLQIHAFRNLVWLGILFG